MSIQDLSPALAACFSKLNDLESAMRQAGIAPGEVEMPTKERPYSRRIDFLKAIRVDENDTPIAEDTEEEYNAARREDLVKAYRLHARLEATLRRLKLHRAVELMGPVEDCLEMAYAEIFDDGDESKEEMR